MSDTVREELTYDVASAACAFVDRPTVATLTYLVAAVHALQSDRGERSNPIATEAMGILKALREVRP